jgi:hypothetical protein
MAKTGQNSRGSDWALPHPDPEHPVADPVTDSITDTPGAGDEAPTPPIRADGRNAKGRFTPGNTVGHRFEQGNQFALVTGAKSKAFWIAVEQSLAERKAVILRDVGIDPADPPAVLADVVTGLCQAVALRDASFNRLVESGGATTDKGKTRAVYKTWEGASDRVANLARMIGLERRGRPVLDPLEEIRRAVAAANEPPADPPPDSET